MHRQLFGRTQPVLLCVALLALSLARVHAQSYSIDWFTIDGGGGTSTASFVMAGISEALVATAVGLFVAIPAVLAFNSEVNADRQEEISAALGAAGEPAAEVLDRLIAGLGLPRRLRDVGVKRDDLQRIAANCMLDDWTFTNPRPIHGAQEIVPILESVY